MTSFQLEALLNSKSDDLLNSYFRPGVVRGKTASIKGYGEVRALLATQMHSTLDTSNSDISNSAKLEGSI